MKKTDPEDFARPDRKPGKTGRPKFRLPIRRIESLAADCLSQREICILIGISEDTFQRRMKDGVEDPEGNPEAAAFAAAYARGWARGKAKNAAKIRTLADKGSERMLELKARCQYGWKDTTRIESTGADGGPLQHQIGPTGEKTMVKVDAYFDALRRTLAAEGGVPPGNGPGKPVDPVDA